MKKTILLLLIFICSFGLFAAGSRESSNISVISREDGSGTRGAFTELVGLLDSNKVDQTTLSAEIANSTSVVLTTVQGNKNAIGYISLGSLNNTVKAVAVDGVAATQENIENGTYKLQRPFNLAYVKLSPVAEDFLKYVFSTQGQSVVESSGYIKAQADTQNYSSSNISGSLSISGSSSVYPLMEKLVEAYKVLNPQLEVTLQQSDSTTGVNDALNGVSDFGMASRELKESEMEKGATPVVIAKDGIAVIVNNENPVSELSLDQIKNIYLGNQLTWE